MTEIPRMRSGTPDPLRVALDLWRPHPIVAQDALRAVLNRMDREISACLGAQAPMVSAEHLRYYIRMDIASALLGDHPVYEMCAAAEHKPWVQA